jgi:hypothetical protein
VRARIDAAIGELEKQLGGLIIDTDVPDAEVVVRGWDIDAKLPKAAPIYLTPGDVSVVIRAPGRADATVSARVALGKVARAGVNLLALGAGVAGGVVGGVGAVGGTLGGGLGRLTGTTPTAQTPTGPSLPAPSLPAPSLPVPSLPAPALVPPAPPIWPIVLGIGGLAVVGGAIAASVSYSNKLDAFDANLCDGGAAGPECPTIESGIKLTTGLQVVGYVLGGAALTVGIVVFGVTRSAKPPELDCPEVGKKAPLPIMLRCGPSLSGNGGGLGCSGAF